MHDDIKSIYIMFGIGKQISVIQSSDGSLIKIHALMPVNAHLGPFYWPLEHQFNTNKWIYKPT